MGSSEIYWSSQTQNIIGYILVFTCSTLEKDRTPLLILLKCCNLKKKNRGCIVETILSKSNGAANFNELYCVFKHFGLQKYHSPMS